VAGHHEAISGNCHTQKRLSGLVLLNIEKDLKVNLDQIVINFIANKEERKMIL
jgi:hypothetical protein